MGFTILGPRGEPRPPPLIICFDVRSLLSLRQSLVADSFLPKQEMSIITESLLSVVN